VKTDRKDAELLARLLLAGSLTSVVVPPVEVEAARELMRAHDACRRDLMTARHRVPKMLLRHGRVYPEPSTWTIAHRRWLATQQFQETASELVLADLITSVDGLSARKAAITQRLSRVAQDEQWWPTVARLRCFRGVDTLTAFALHLELGGDWQRFARATPDQVGISGSGRAVETRFLELTGAERTPEAARGDAAVYRRWARPTLNVSWRHEIP
jgi:transposase